jgi:hypothetical protein
MALTDTLMTTALRLVPESVRRPAWLRPRYPLVAIEVREDALVAVRLQRRGTGYALAGYGRRALPEGAFCASLMQPGTHDPEALAKGFGDVLRLAGAEGTNRISVAVPDSAARVSLVDVQEMPPTHAQAEEMIRFRIRRAIPFRPEESRLSWDVLGHGDDGRLQVLVAIAPEGAVRAVEGVLAGMGIRCGLVDLSTFDVYNALRLEGAFAAAVAGSPAAAGTAPDVALLNATPTYFSLVILRGQQVVFYRSKAYHVQGGFQGEESLRVVGREVRSSLGYYEEHLLGQGIGVIWLRAAGIPAEGLLDTLAAAGCADVKRAEASRVVPELRQVPPEVAVDLLPALGLALRRIA